MILAVMAHALLHDLRYAWRHLRRSPGFTAAAILTLALGIGANAAIFTMLNALVIRRLPIADPDGLISVTSRNAAGVQRFVTITAVDELAKDGPLLGACAYYGGFNIAVEANQAPTPALAAFMTGRCLDTFGVRPILGRPITDEDAPLWRPGRRVALLGHRFWTRMFGADPQAVGKTIRTEGIELTVIGVLPPEFGGLEVDAGMDVFAPFDTIFPAPANRRPLTSDLLGRLRPGRTLEQASAEIATRWPALLEATVSTAIPANEAADLFGAVPRVARIGNGVSDYRTRYASTLTIILGLTSLLLVLACVNLGGLLLARVSARAVELRVRLALGAGWWRLSQQMLVESLVLSLGGAAVAVPVSIAIVRSLAAVLPTGNVAPTVAFTPDARVLVVTAVVGVAVGVLMSALPMWMAARPHLGTQTWDRTIAPAAGGWVRALLVTQVALSAILLVGAGLLIRSLYLLHAADLGIRTQGVIYTRLLAVPNGYRGLETASYYPPLIERLAALPGVRAVGFSRTFPRGVTPAKPTLIAFVGEPFGNVSAILESTTPGFFETVGIPLVAGRTTSWSDTDRTRRIVLVSQSLARALAPDGNVLGRHVRYGTVRELQDAEIVGIVGNATLGNPRMTTPPTIYAAPMQMSRGFTMPHLVIAADGTPSGLAAGIRQIVQEGGREYAHEIVGLDDLLARAPSSERMSAPLAGAVGFLAVLMTFIGIHGALAYAVARRTREIGVRVAIGASPRAAAAAVVREAVTVTALGLAIGLPAAILGARTIRTLIFGISESDPLTFAATAAFVLLVGAAAGALPARRAASVDPIVALRAE